MNLWLIIGLAIVALFVILMVVAWWLIKKHSLNYLDKQTQSFDTIWQFYGFLWNRLLGK